MCPLFCCAVLCLVQAKSKKLMWRMNRGIVKDLLPQAPLNIQIGGRSCPTRGVAGAGPGGMACRRAGRRSVPATLLLAHSYMRSHALPSLPACLPRLPSLQTPGGWCMWSTWVTPSTASWIQQRRLCATSRRGPAARGE